MEPRDRIKQWSGGRLPVIGFERELDPAGEIRLTRKSLPPVQAVPFGNGFAWVPGEVEIMEPHVLLRYEVRDDQPQCVAIIALPDGPELTGAILRQLKVDVQTREWRREHTLRLELDERGRVVGVSMFSPRHPSDMRTRAVVEHELGLPVHRPGRPAISTAELARVAEIVRDAQHSGQPTGTAVAEEFHLSIDAAKKRIQKARQRGLLEQAKPRRRK